MEERLACPVVEQLVDLGGHHERGFLAGSVLAESVEDHLVGVSVLHPGEVVLRLVGVRLERALVLHAVRVYLILPLLPPSGVIVERVEFVGALLNGSPSLAEDHLALPGDRRLESALTQFHHRLFAPSLFHPFSYRAPVVDQAVLCLLVLGPP